MNLRLLVAVAILGVLWTHGTMRRHRSAPQRRRAQSDPSQAKWAQRGDLRPLLVAKRPPDRVVVGRLHRRSTRFLALEGSHSLLVVGPTQSGKTTAVAVPAIRSWRGPVIATSVKTDLARVTRAFRDPDCFCGIFDPSSATGLGDCEWAPLRDARSYGSARRLASCLVEAARIGTTSGDAEFWYQSALKLLAPLFFAAAHASLEMRDVRRWLDTQETDEVVAALVGCDAPDTEVGEALRALRASFGRDERQRSALYATAETILECFADHDGSSSGTRIDPVHFFDSPSTLYLCAPAHEQRRLRPLFSALLSRLLNEAYTRASVRGAPLTPPLLVVLDEAANVAPINDLDAVAATGSGHGISLVSIFQDVAQIQARYGERAPTVVNNHRGRLFLPGVADLTTLEQASTLIGQTRSPHASITRADRGERSVTHSDERVALLSPDALRRLPRGDGVLVYGSLPPVRLALAPWEDRGSIRRVRGWPKG